ncbi:sugar phosphate isomerase/epimerase family protein [Schlesneria paludicola]|uniref:sugar phosphate isomerase/epimerase family protein n=1 Tax=Schlesneria paludicola TaxID=360056 RepID=UPI00029AD757|nr:sugar phosphate isomerase/epimerase [Schlesneria paludicola]
MAVSLNRRDFLLASAAGIAAASISRAATAADGNDPYLGLKMGIQSYSLRGFKKAEEALELTKKLGLKYWESFPGHIPMSTVPKHIEAQKGLLAKEGITCFSYGVVGFDGNENAAREIFEFAKAMGIKSLSADPKPDAATFDLLDKLVAEYDVAIAIHNHGPKHRYDKISDVEKVVKDRHPKIGACVDTGHYLRSNENPVEAVQRLNKRVFGVHLKDVKTLPNGEKQFKIAGEGDLDVTGLLKALKAMKYEYCVAIEYEENESNPMPDIEACLKHVRECALKLV